MCHNVLMPLVTFEITLRRQIVLFCPLVCAHGPLHSSSCSFCNLRLKLETYIVVRIGDRLRIAGFDEAEWGFCKCGAQNSFVDYFYFRIYFSFLSFAKDVHSE
jgi:hypothetical protein